MTVGLMLLSGQEASEQVKTVHGIRKEVFLYETLIDRYKRHPPVPAAAIDELGFINHVSIHPKSPPFSKHKALMMMLFKLNIGLAD